MNDYCNTLMENDLEILLMRLERTPEKMRDYTDLYHFFSKIVQKNIKLYIGPSLKEYIGFLSLVDNGRVWPIAQPTFSNYAPSMLVPPLKANKAFTPRRPAKLTLSPRPPTIPRSLFVPPPERTMFKTTYLKPVSDRDILPRLAAAPVGNFYYCKPKTQRGPSSMSFRIHTKKNPIVPPTPETHTLTQRGMFNMYANKSGEFIELDDLLEDKEKMYMTKLLPVFRNWFRNKAFIKWSYAVRRKRFTRLVAGVLNSPPFESRTFTDMYFKIRSTYFNAFQENHPISPDMLSDTFANLKINSEQSVQKIRDDVLAVNEKVKVELEHFFEQIRGIAVLLRSDFEILKTIGALPASLLPYSIEHQTNCPSITSVRMRNQLLFKERKLAYERKEHLVNFFLMLRLFLRDYFAEEIRKTLSELYYRFIADPPIASHQIILHLDKNEGLVMSPTRDEFFEWFASLDHEIWSVFLSHQLELNEEAIQKLFGDSQMPSIMCVEDTVMNAEISSLKESAVAAINSAYDFFGERLSASRDFFRDTQVRIEELHRIDDYATPAEYIKTQAEFKEIMQRIDGQARVLEHGAFFTDMKGAKITTLAALREAMEKSKEIGLSKTRAMYNDLQDLRLRYLQESALRQPPSPEDKLFIREMLEQLQSDALTFLELATDISSNWTDGALELSEKLEAAKDILAVAQNGLKKKKVKRKRKLTEPQKEE